MKIEITKREDCKKAFTSNDLVIKLNGEDIGNSLMSLTLNIECNSRNSAMLEIVPDDIQIDVDVIADLIAMNDLKIVKLKEG